MSFSFHIEKKMPGRLGRIGTITTPHGALLTPAFVTVGTKATVKSLTSDIANSKGGGLARD
jgi:queuine tRNA-ribosyltransferase